MSSKNAPFFHSFLSDTERLGVRVRPALLVSVRDEKEAKIALDAGVDLLDVKEPQHGPLGRAATDVLTEIAALKAAFPTVHFSAALGELQRGSSEKAPLALPAEYDFVKTGLSDCHSDPRWSEKFSQFRKSISEFIRPGTVRWVAVAYADHESCNAPLPETVLRVAIETNCDGLLVDTWSKSGLSTFDYLPEAQLKSLRQKCRESGLFFALAGSIKQVHLERVVEIDPDIVAVRGAVCEEQLRTSEISLSAIENFISAMDQLWVQANS
ncbi:MAG: (5-formylfuran-3-yl)methyl phosphate synthase [Planctomycetaceae bacterium]|nr:(5-formylfuran-3-yl)methyl phosphate synthase [Planctomycetaceae bacterium]